MRRNKLSDRNPTADLVAVYRARYGHALNQVIRVLRDAGLAPQPLDAPAQPLWDKGSWTRNVTVGVPPDEVEHAREVLAEWNRQAAPKVVASVAELKTQFLLSLIPPAVYSLILLLLSSVLPDGAWLFLPLVWLVGFGVISHVRRQGKDE